MIDQAQKLREMMSKNNKARIITVTSGKGGVGKSSFSLNLAIELIRRGKRVLLVDSDFGFSNIDIMLGVSTRYSLLDVMNGTKEVMDIIEYGTEGVQFISGGSGLYDLVQMDGLQIDKLINSFKDLDDIVDIVIFDTGAGVSENILKLIYASNETILVTTPEPTSITDAYALIKIACRKNPNPNISLVLNKAKSKKEAEATMEGFARIVESYMNLHIEKLGHILRDGSMADSVKMQQPLLVSFPKSNAALNIKEIVDKYLDIPKEKSGSWGFKNFFKKLRDAEDKEPYDWGEKYDFESSG